MGITVYGTQYTYIEADLTNQSCK